MQRVVNKLMGTSAVLIAGMVIAGAAEATPRVLVNCWGCTEQQMINAAIEATAIPGDADVYVVPEAAESAKRFYVSIDSEPGLFDVSVVPMSLETEVAEALVMHAEVVRNVKSFVVEDHNLPVACRAEGVAQGAAYVGNQLCADGIHHLLEQRLRNTQVAAQRRLEQAIDRFLTGTQTGKPKIEVVIRTPDGSEIRLEVKLGVDYSDGSTFMYDFETTRVTLADGLRIPVSPAQADGRTWSGLTTGQVRSLHAALRGFGRTVHLGECKTIAEVVCPPSGGGMCKVHVQCR